MYDNKIHEESVDRSCSRRSTSICWSFVSKIFSLSSSCKTSVGEIRLGEQASNLWWKVLKFMLRISYLKSPSIRSRMSKNKYLVNENNDRFFAKTFPRNLYPYWQNRKETSLYWITLETIRKEHVLQRCFLCCMSTQ